MIAPQRGGRLPLSTSGQLRQNGPGVTIGLQHAENASFGSGSCRFKQARPFGFDASVLCEQGRFAGVGGAPVARV